MRIDLEDLYPVMEAYLNEGKEVTFTVTGKSMVPILVHRRDQVVLVKQNGPLGKGDLPLYRRADGKFILHRVIAVKNGIYTMCGDGQFVKEEGITDDNILGVAIGIIRNGRKISVRSRKYRIYVFLWMQLLPVRRYLLGVLRRIKPEFFVLD